MKKEKKKPKETKKKQAVVKKKKTGQTTKDKPEKKLRVLILEDNPADAELMERQLRRGEIACITLRTETRSGFRNALKAFGPDIILADYTLPKFDALQALKLARESSPFLPFIVITGTIGEEKAVSCLRFGADDYLLKDRLARLPETVRHALETRRLQLEKTKSEETLRASERLHRVFIDSSADMAFLKDAKFRHLMANKSLCRFFKKTEKEILGKTDAQLMEKSAAARCRKTDRHMLAKNKVQVSEETVGGLVFETRKFPVKLPDGSTGIGGYIRDISESKRLFEMIEQSSKKWFTTFDSIQDAILLLATDQTVLQANQAFADLVKKPFKAIVGKKCYELVHADRQPDPQCPFARSAKNNKREFMELEINDRIFRIVTDPLIQDSRGFSGAVHVMTDITEYKRNQELLQATSKRLQLALHSAKAGTWDWDIVSGHIEWSPQMFDLFGLDPQTASASFASWREALHPEDRKLAENRIDLALKQHATLDSDYRIILPDGQIRWINATGVGVYDKAGRPIQMIGICQDISERKRMESALRESEERFRGLVENAAIGMYRTTPDGRILMANPTLLRMLSFASFAQLAERNLEDAGFEPTYSRQNFKERLEREGLVTGLEATWKRRDGSAIQVRESAIVRRGETGEISFYDGTVEDVSREKRAESALKEMSEIFRLFLKHNPIYVFIKDENIRPIYLSDNYERLLGRPVSEILGKPMDELFPSELSRSMIEDDKRILREGDVREFVEELNGRTYSTMKFPIIIDGKAKYLAGYTTDISERVQTEEKINASLREKEILLKEIHHRVKNNLQVISGLLTLQAAQINDERLQRIIKDSQNRIWTMSLIHQALYQSGDMSAIHMNEFIRELVRNVLGSYARTESMPDITLQLAPLQLSIDRAIPLALILNELLTNAIKHAFPEGRSGRITIMLQKKGVEGEISPPGRRDAILDVETTPREGTPLRVYSHELIVSDDGIGLVDGFDAVRQKSLGFQLVGMLAKQMGGTIVVDSGKGTTLRVAFNTNEKREK